MNVPVKPDDAGDQPISDGPLTPQSAKVAGRFGVLPNFFRLAPETPDITSNLWGFAEFGYLDNPLPSLFKERLFVYLSRFCEVRYCIARHAGFLLGQGHPSGDRLCPPQPVEQVVRLIRRPLPRGEALGPHLALLEACTTPFPVLPESDTPAEEALFACATHVFLQTPQASRGLEALRRAFDATSFQHLLVFLAFVRTAHYWTKVHPELAFEDDIRELLATDEVLADCLLNDPEAATCETTQVLLDELEMLRRERMLREALAEAERIRKRTVDLERADTQKDQFLAMLAHELRNPLAAMSTAVQFLLAKGTADPEVQWGRDVIARQAKQLARLVDDLLDVSRIPQGKLRLQKERVALPPIIARAVETVRPLMDEKRHELIFSPSTDPLWLEADPMRLEQILVNLLTNAAKYTEPDGRIELSSRREGEDIVVVVRDSGIGIAPELLPRVFDLFMQLDSSLEQSRGGLGIGLALVKRLVELHGGSISVTSEGAGRGSEFLVRLPAATGPDVELPPPAVRAPEAKRPGSRVLVVDDDVDAAWGLATLLKASGHEVQTVHDGPSAVEMARILRPDAILLDLGLPGMDGFQVAQLLREDECCEDSVFIAVSGYGQDEDRRRSHEAGFDHHLLKPVNFDELITLLSPPNPATMA